MPETERRLLAAYKPRGGHLDQGCGSAMLIVAGLPAMAVGVFVLTGGLGLMRLRLGEGIPIGLLRLVGALFLVSGILVAGVGVQALLSARRLRRLAEAHGAEPWLFEQPWTAEGVADLRESLAGSIAFALFLALFLSPFNWVVMLPQVPFFARALVLLFDLVLVIVAGSVGYVLLQRLRYGRARVAFDAFPFFLGQDLSARFVAARGLEGCRRLVFHLRCIEEIEGGREEPARCEQIWAETCAVEGPLVTAEVPLRFALPKGPEYRTSFLERPTRYWLLEVEGEAPGVDLRAAFLLPVYAPPG